MELFVMNRYLGTATSPTNEEELRQKLNSKIEERQKLKSKREREDSVSEDISANNSNPEKKQKLTETEDVGVSEGGALKTKRKRKRRRNKGIEEQDENNVTSLDNNAGEISEDEVHDGFQVLGDKEFLKKEKVKRVLPDWLANPTIISSNLQNLTTKIEDIVGLDECIISQLRKFKITHFFPVQAQVIPYLLSNAKKFYWSSDICVSAPTGSGKTLSFILPILQHLRNRIVPYIRALVVLPVQDLATQVNTEFIKYATKTDLKIHLLKSNVSLKEEANFLVRKDMFGKYESLVDIVVTTPGRLVDHLKSTDGFTLKHLRYLVIDEADRVVENVQNDWLYHYNKHMNSECTTSYQTPYLTVKNFETKPRPPQKLLFSATLSQDPEKLQQLSLFQPKLFTSVVKNSKMEEDDKGEQCDKKRRGDFIGKYTTPDELTEKYVLCTSANRPLVLYHLIKSQEWRHVLCFVKSTETSTRLAALLRCLSNGKIKVSEISSSLHRTKRDLIIKKFSAGVLDIIVSTDSLARGIDIPNVKYVVSYEPTKFIKNYIHRVGRTGRAGHHGTAVSLVQPDQLNHFKQLIETAGKSNIEELTVGEDELECYTGDYQTAVESLKNILVKRQIHLSNKKKFNKNRKITKTSN